MRFSLATAMLLQAYPLLSGEGVTGSDNPLAQNGASTAGERRTLHQPAALLKRLPLAGVRNKLSKRKLQKSAGQNNVECDPSTVDPDIGILSCPPDKRFCMEDQASTLGGFCVDVSVNAARHLQDDLQSSLQRGFIYCDPSSPYFGILQCDCDGFSLETNEGSFTCTYDSYCFGDVSECCSNTCAALRTTYSSTDVDFYTYETCYSFQSPYEQSFCYGRQVNRKEQSLSCFGSFDGKSCNSCLIGSAQCTMFDCSVAGLDGAFCLEEFYPPILTSCYAQCATCTICPGTPDGSVANPDALLGFTDLTCGHVEFLGDSGYWGGPNNQSCLSVMNAVQKTCCEPDQITAAVFPTRPPESPPLSGNDETLAPSIAPAPQVTNQPVGISSDVVDRSPPVVTCRIQIQTSKCTDLLEAEAERIPCECFNQCISFVDDKFQKCDGGTNVAGSGTLVAGCTFDMSREAIFKCKQPTEEEVAGDGAQGYMTQRGRTRGLMALPLLAYFYYWF